MRVSIGMREMKDLYSRANVCVGCHQNIDPEIVANGHVPLTFELDDFDTRETAHWKDKGTWLGPKRWLTGQAVALRELSWSLSNQHANPAANRGMKVMQDRWSAVSWVLRKTDQGRSLPAGSDYVATQAASDRIARNAASEQWTKDGTLKLMRTLAATRQEFGKGNAETSPASAQRCFMLAAALRRFTSRCGATARCRKMRIWRRRSTPCSNSRKTRPTSMARAMGACSSRWKSN